MIMARYRRKKLSRAWIFIFHNEKIDNLLYVCYCINKIFIQSEVEFLWGQEMN